MKLSSVGWVVIGLIVGLLIGRLWQGGLLDTAFMIVVVVLVIALARSQSREMTDEEQPSDETEEEPDEPFDPDRHLILARRTKKIVARLQNFGRWQFVEFAIRVPTWFFPAREKNLADESQGEIEQPIIESALSLLSLVQQFQRAHRWRSGAVFIAFGFALLVALFLLGMPLAADYTFVVALWLAAIIIFIVAVSQSPQGNWAMSLPRLESPRRRSIIVLLLISGITLIAFALRVWHLGTIPFSLGGDEASQGLEALKVIRGEMTNPFTTGWYSVPTMSFFFNSITLRLFGATITALRLPWVLVGALTVLVTFGLVARLAGLRLGLLSAGLLAVYHYHIHFSRLGSNQVADPLFIALTFFFLYRALARHRNFDWAMAGAVSAASMYFYAGARLTLILIVVVLAYEFLHDRKNFWCAHRVGLLIALGSFLIVGAPMLEFALRFPDDFNSRVNQVGIFQNGWIQLAQQVTGQSVPQLLFDQFRRAALAFNFYPDRTAWYGLRQPLLDPIFGVLFLLGLGYATVRVVLPRGDRRLFPMVAWWWGATILGGMLTESPPSSMRLVSLTVPVCFLTAFAAWKLIRLAKKAIRGVPVNALAFATFVLFAVISLKTYFIDYTPQRIYGSSRAEAATMLAPILNPLVATHKIYFVGAPYMYWNFATLPFLVPNADAVDINDPIAVPPTPDLIVANKGAVFVIVPERASELDVIQQTWQHGRLAEIHSPVNDQLLALIYVVE